MHFTAPSSLPATHQTQFALPLSNITAAFTLVPDPRRRQGTRSPLPAMLTLALAAILCNHRSLLAIAEWGAAQPPATKQALGFPGGRTPHVSTFQRLFRRLDPARLGTALTTFFDPCVPEPVRERSSQGIAIDGKAQRGRLPYEATRTHPIHTVSAMCHDVGVVLAEIAVDAQQHQAELTVVPTLLQQIDWQGRVLTGDALYCQRKLCAQVVEAGGDYLVLVDNNQPTLQADIAQVFAPPPPPQPGHGPILMEEQHAQRIEKGHGRLEVREIRVSSELAGYLNWPYVAQVFVLKRTWTRKGNTKHEVRYGITSRPQALAAAERVLQLKRGHWGIENRLHDVKDVILGEDQSPLHCGASPHVMAMLRNTAISMLRRAGYHQIAARLRYHSRRPETALALLGLS